MKFKTLLEAYVQVRAVQMDNIESRHYYHIDGRTKEGKELKKDVARRNRQIKTFERELLGRMNARFKEKETSLLEGSPTGIPIGILSDEELKRMNK